LKEVGLEVPTAQRRNYISLSIERLDLLDGDVMFLILDANARESWQRLQRSLLWQRLKVVQNNQVFVVDSGYWVLGNILAANAILDDLFKYLVKKDI
jgi:iron complex transport system substrate-binding protein